MVLFGRRSKGRDPSPVPRMSSGNTCTSIAFSPPSGPGTVVVPMKEPTLISASEILMTPHHPHVAGHTQPDVLAAARFDEEHIAVDAFDGAAKARRRGWLLGDCVERRRDYHCYYDKRTRKR
jgi:hypothetical protein